MRRTKIVCTLGPASSTIETIVQLIEAGMNVARFNFSHGTHESHLALLKTARDASEKAGTRVAFLLDTKGPEIRTGKTKNGKLITLQNDALLELTAAPSEGTEQLLTIRYPSLVDTVPIGGHIYIADGLIDLEVTEKVEAPEGDRLRCIVRNGGTIGSQKNVNIPDIHVDLPFMTKKDRADIEFGLHHNFDFIAASFVRTIADVAEIRQIVNDNGKDTKIIAKIENRQGLDNIEKILEAADGVMIARGDLGVQLPVEAVPLAQKRIIAASNRCGKPSITATQMLDSMIRNPRPTRAELTDAANAVFDGTDALMLSGETASGKYPIRATQMLNRIAITIEQSAEFLEKMRTQTFEKIYSHSDHEPFSIGISVAQGACTIAQNVNATAIVTPSIRGNTPRMISALRPSPPIIAATPQQQVARQLLLYWGVYPVIVHQVQNANLMVQNALNAGLRQGYINLLDKVISTAGIPIQSPFPINTIQIHFMGNILNRGNQGFGKVVSAPVVCSANADKEFQNRVPPDTPILVTPMLTPSMEFLFPHLRGIIVEKAMQISKAQIQAVNPTLTVIAEVADAMGQFETGQLISLDGKEKIVYEGLLEQ